MGDYTDAIERINIELSIANKLELLRRAATLVLGGEPLGADATRCPAPNAGRAPPGPRAADAVRTRWQYELDSLDPR